MTHKRIKWAMIGGALDAMIGPIHRHAAWLDNQYELVAGAFSRHADKNQQAAEAFGVQPNRCYDNYEQLIASEMTLPESERIKVLSIVTPNDQHFPIAEAALRAGLDIILEKPITCTLQQARALQALAKTNNRQICLLYTYAGYPMLKEARQRIQAGQIGAIKRIKVTFTQGWLNEGSQSNIWRQDPKTSGPSCTMADIGVHAFHLTEYLTGAKATAIAADLNHAMHNHQLDDDGAMLLRYDNGAKGTLIASQIAVGEKANLRIEIYGETGTISWQHLHSNELHLQLVGKPHQVLLAGKDSEDISDIAKANCRTPAGHPEGYLEAFANHYHNFAKHIQSLLGQGKYDVKTYDYPSIAEGVRGLEFIEAVIRSNQKNTAWVSLNTTVEADSNENASIL